MNIRNIIVKVGVITINNNSQYQFKSVDFIFAYKCK